MKLKASLYDENALKRAIVRIAHEIVENNQSVNKLCLVGIKTRGIPFAQRLSEAIERIEGKKIPVGILDITMHRDDLHKKPQSESETKIDFDITGMDVVLTDDVIYTGRTVRAAMDALNPMADLQKFSLLFFATEVIESFLSDLIMWAKTSQPQKVKWFPSALKKSTEKILLSYMNKIKKIKTTFCCICEWQKVVLCANH